VFFFYIDESGNLDCEVEGNRPDGKTFVKDHLFVLTAVSLFDQRWRRFENAINGKKRELMARVEARGVPRLDLADCEVKSSWVRDPKARGTRRFLSALYSQELTELIEVFYAQVEIHKMNVFSVVIDKRHLLSYFDQAKLHRKAWELLVERLQAFLEIEHRKHAGVLVTDDVSREANRSLAMKHAHLLAEGTSAAKHLRHITEMPLFVRSELSNGVQLADLVSYNVYRAFKRNHLEYEWFRRIEPAIWWASDRGPGRDGLKVFPPESPLYTLADTVRLQRQTKQGPSSARPFSRRGG
jgi:hypothetical protein